MIIQYGYASGHDVLPAESFAEAVRSGERVWLFADGVTLRCLPTEFNREVMVDDRTLRSSVLMKHEIAGGWCKEAEGFLPRAPILTMDFNHGRVLWRQGGETRVLYEEATGHVG
jgi:hypothetical protein